VAAPEASRAVEPSLGRGGSRGRLGADGSAEVRLAALARAAGPLRRVLAALAARLVDGPGPGEHAGGEKDWERIGYARLADYARERLGVSARSLQDLARVGRRLGVLPRLEAALVAGELPWSKVRLLARFATPADEGAWIAQARGQPVRALERSLRAVDRAALEVGGLAVDEEGGEAAPCERLSLRGPVALAFKWQRAKEYASRVAGERLPAGAVLEMVTAETLSALPLDAEAEDEPSQGVSWSELRASAVHPRSEPPASDGGLSWGGECSEAANVCAPQRVGPGLPCPARPRAGAASSPDANRARSTAGRAVWDDTLSEPRALLPPFLRPLLEGLAEADAFELDARLRRALRLEQRLDAEIAPLLRVVTAAEYAWKVCFTTLETLARERLGMSPRKARALRRLERLGDGCPALRRAFREGRVSWVQAQVLAPLLTLRGEGQGGRWQEAWLELAGRVTVRALEERVGAALALREADPAAWERGRGEPERCGRELRVSEKGVEEIAAGEWQTCARARERAEGVRIQVVAPREVARLFRAVLSTLRRAVERRTGRLPGEGEAFEAMLDHALESWGADDPWLRRHLRTHYQVFERDGWRCTVPGCSVRRNLHAHHIVFRSAGGSDALANQTTLCAVHHQRGVHAGRVRIRGRAPGGLAYELGLRPGLPPLARYRSGDRVA
jgi:hypothetical protein